MNTKSRDELYEREQRKALASGRGDHPICNLCNLCDLAIFPGQEWDESHFPIPKAFDGNAVGIAHRRHNREHGAKVVTPMVAKMKRQRSKHTRVSDPDKITRRKIRPPQENILSRNGRACDGGESVNLSRQQETALLTCQAAGRLRPEASRYVCLFLGKSAAVYFRKATVDSLIDAKLMKRTPAGYARLTPLGELHAGRLDVLNDPKSICMVHFFRATGKRT